MGSKRSGISTKGEQIALSALLGTLSIAACVWVAVYYYRSVDEHISKFAESVLTGTTGDAAAWLKGKRDKVELMSKAAAAFRGRPEEIQTLLRSVRTDDTDFIDIVFGSAEPPGTKGYAVFASEKAAPPGYDWTTQAWFAEAVKKGKLTVIGPYKDTQTGAAVLTIAKPVYSNGVFLGVIASDISPDSVQYIVLGAYTVGAEKLRLLDGSGRVIGNAHEEAGTAILDRSGYSTWKGRMLSGGFFIRTDPLADRYFASIGIPDLGWIMLAEGTLSSFEDVRGTVVRFTAIILFMACLFMFMLLRTWRSNSKLAVATETIARANKDLELVVADRTASLKNILDSAEEGFLTFGASFEVDPNYSRGCALIFGKDIAGASAPDLLFPGQTETASDFRKGFELFFQGKSKAEIIFDLTEKQTELRGRTIRITYKETAGQRILCILTDVTLELEVAEKNRREAETQKRILRAIHNRHSFAQYVGAADSLFGSLEVYATEEPAPDEFKTFLRQLHTFKGDAGFFGFSETQTVAHESETLANDSAALGTCISYRELLIQLRKAYYRELKTITDTLGERWLDESLGVTVPRDQFRKLSAYLRKKAPEDAKLHLFLSAFQKVSLSELFSRLPFAAAVAAERLGKRIRPMAINGGTLKIVPDRYLPFVDSCIHIVNNMVDHGIEYPYERESLQKPPEGTLELSIVVEGSTLVLEFRDDGRGLNPKELEKIARSRQLIPEGRTLPASELYDLIFQDGFSTRMEASQSSGRGVGLAAVRAEVEKLGGTIEAKSKLGKGSAFEITIPLKQ